MTTLHPSDSTLQSLHDGASVPAHVTAHVSTCVECTAHLDSYGALSEIARALPRESTPPASVWAAVRKRLAFDRSSRQRGPARRVRFFSSARVLGVAASITLVALSAIGVWMDRDHRAASAPSDQFISEAYREALAPLERALEAHGGEFDPATLAAIHRSLQVIDSAIVNSQLALAAQPESADLRLAVAWSIDRRRAVLQHAARYAFGRQ